MTNAELMEKHAILPPIELEIENHYSNEFCTGTNGEHKNSSFSAADRFICNFTNSDDLALTIASRHFDEN